MKGNFSTCMDQNGEFPFGNYAFALPLIVKNSNVVKILYSGLWGIMSLRYIYNCYAHNNLCAVFLILIVSLVSYDFAVVFVMNFCMVGVCSTMGSNFDLTSQTTEVSFAIVMVLAGLSLFTFLIGNIQVIIFKIIY